MCNTKDVSASDPVSQAPLIILETANGIIRSTTVAQQSVPIGSESISVESRILHDSPSVLALGRLCMLQGYGFVWCTGQLPMLVSPSNKVFEIPLQHFVPVVDSVNELSSDIAQQRIQEMIDRVVAEYDLSHSPAVVSNAQAPSIEQQYSEFVELGLPSHCLVFELCTSPDSEFGNRGLQHGFFTLRVCESHDLFDDSTYDILCCIRDQNLEANAHASLPCTPWSRFQNLCMSQSKDRKAFKYRLERQRRASEKLVKLFSTFAAPLTGSKSFEWPDSAHDGHHNAVVCKMKSSLKLDNCARVCACAAELYSQKQQLFYGKKWRFDCSSPVLAAHLSVLQCPNINAANIVHQHAVVEGSETASTARYTTKLADTFFLGLRAHHGLPVVTKAAAADVLQNVPLLTKEQQLREEARSLTHLLAHRPFNPYCESCVVAKQKRSQHRRLAPTAVDSYSGEFGSFVYGDHIISRSSEGLNGETCACFLRDRKTGAEYAYPSDTNDASSTQDALRHFIGNQLYKTCIVASDNSREFISAVRALDVVHQPTKPNEPESHGIQERAEQSAIQGARVALREACLPINFWPYALRHFCVAHMLQKGTLQQLQNGRKDHPFLLAPFGSLVTVKGPTSEFNAKFASAGEECVFLGWHLLPGLQFRDEYIVVRLSDLLEGKSPNVFRSSNVRNLPSLQFPLKDFSAKAKLAGFIQANGTTTAELNLQFDGDEDEEDQFGHLPPPVGESSSSSAPPNPGLLQPPVNSKAKLGRPATRMPEGWEYEVWSRLSKKQQQKIIDDIAEKGKVSALVSLFTSLMYPSTIPQSVNAPSSFPSQPDVSTVRGARVEHDFPLLQDPGPHRAAEPPIFSCVTRTLRRGDKEWYCEAAQQALDDECVKLLARQFVDVIPVEFDSIAQLFPDAVYADVMTILGLKFAELDPSCWKFKARSVLRGDQVRDVSDGESHIFVETASAPSNMETFKSVAVFSEIEGEPATTSDALQAFTQVILQPKDGPPSFLRLNDPIWSKHLPIMKQFRKPYFRQLRNLYGDQRASLLWENHLSSAATACGWTQLPLGQTFGKAYNGDQPITLPQPFDLDSTVLVLQKVPKAKLRILVFTSYVDDMAMGGKGQDHEWKLLRKYIECDDPVLFARMLGSLFETLPHPEKKHVVIIRMSMSGYALSACNKYEQTPGSLPLKPADVPLVEPAITVFQGSEIQEPGIMAQYAASLLMTLLYLGRMVRVDIVFAVCFLARDITRWSKVHDSLLHKLFCYLSSHLDLALHLTVSRQDKESLCLMPFPDSDHAGDSVTCRSTSGNSLVLKGEETFGLMQWSSRRQTAVSHSSTESETVSAEKIMREVAIPWQMFWSFALARHVLVRLQEDNQACIKIIMSGYSLALRHISKTHRINIAWLAERFAEKDRYVVEYVKSEDQLSDGLTKPLPRIKFIRACELWRLFPVSSKVEKSSAAAVCGCGFDRAACGACGRGWAQVKQLDQG